LGCHFDAFGKDLALSMAIEAMKVAPLGY